MSRNRATKMAINNAVWIARYAGIIKPEPCSECRATEHIHAHHDDYNYPLMVRWLCHSCHAKHHSGNERATQPAPEICGKKPTFYYRLGIEQMGGKYWMKGAELKEWRKQRNLTQGFVAELVGVSYPAYKRWESAELANNTIPQPIAILISLMEKINPMMRREGWELDVKAAIPA